MDWCGEGAVLEREIKLLTLRGAHISHQPALFAAGIRHPELKIRGAQLFQPQQRDREARHRPAPARWIYRED